MIADEAQVRSWTASDGVELAYRTMGQGPRTAILVHGLFSDGVMNWIKFGHAAKLADAGFCLIIPDLRAHGLSDAPHDPSKYYPGVLGRDLIELVEQLGLEDYDLVGFSLGTRTTVQAVGEGLKPRKAVLAGAGLEGLSGWLRRKDFFVEAIERFDSSTRGDPHWLSIQFMKTMKVDLEAAKLLLGTFADTKPEWLAAFTMPTMVLCGTEDHDNGSAEELAKALPNATYVPVPGTHLSSVAKGDFGDALRDFLK